MYRFGSDRLDSITYIVLMDDKRSLTGQIEMACLFVLAGDVGTIQGLNVV